MNLPVLGKHVRLIMMATQMVVCHQALSADYVPVDLSPYLTLSIPSDWIQKDTATREMISEIVSSQTGGVQSAALLNASSPQKPGLARVRVNLKPPFDGLAEDLRRLTTAQIIKKHCEPAIKEGSAAQCNVGQLGPKKAVITTIMVPSSFYDSKIVLQTYHIPYPTQTLTVSLSCVETACPQMKPELEKIKRSIKFGE